MLSDLNQFDSPATLEVDICIVGAGAAGITIALELIDSGLSVLLVESGSLEYEQSTQNLYKGENVSFMDFPLETTRLRYFGGTTNHWGGMCRQLDSYDFRKESSDQWPSWPLSKPDLMPYYAKAQELCELGDSIYDNYSLRADLPGENPFPDDTTRLKPVFFQRSKPTRFGQKYVEQLKRSHNVHVLLHANIKELVDTEDRTKITSISLCSLKGHQVEVKARQYVLAAGGLENPRILLFSKRHNINGIANTHDLVGRSYMDHFGTYIGKILFNRPVSSDAVFFQEKNFKGTRIGGCLAPTEKLLNEKNIGNFIFLFGTGTEPDLSIEMLKSIKQDISSMRWPENLLTKLSKIVSNADTMANLAYKNIFDTDERLFDIESKKSGQLCSVSINMEQFQNNNSRVLLSNELDSLGLPKIKLDWQLCDEDKRTLEVATRELAGMLGKTNSGRLRITSDLEKNNPSYSISCHHSGTTRMSKDPQNGVVDKDCKAHGIENLYIIGSSVFPSIGWANPTLTIVALSVRLAEKLKRTHTTRHNV
ncbi:MAG: GMC family oxidoreductase [Porticoccaceae bacterium]